MVLVAQLLLGRLPLVREAAVPQVLGQGAQPVQVWQQAPLQQHYQ